MNYGLKHTYDNRIFNSLSNNYPDVALENQRQVIWKTPGIFWERIGVKL
ncbi:MAG: hypothetical protein WCP55_20070 [Lentisphaerota bacterium]